VSRNGNPVTQYFMEQALAGPMGVEAADTGETRKPFGDGKNLPRWLVITRDYA